MLLLCFQNSLPAIAQTTEQQYMERYWNYRDRYKKWFVKIGREAGESINLTENDPKGGGGALWTSQLPINAGSIKTGDATSNLGTYMVVLATEYKLLKDAGQSTTATLNELYYVIQAINRLDKKAEPYFDHNQAENLNGFFMRDDMPHEFHESWGKNNFNPYGNIPGSTVTSGTNERRDYVTATHCDFYDEQNPGSPKFSNNEESIDQVVGLMMGFVFIKKYVDPLFVQPTPQDAPVNLVAEVAAITDRIITYISQLKVVEDYPAAIAALNILAVPSALGQTINAICSLTDNLDPGDIKMKWVITNPVNDKLVENGGGWAQMFSYPLCAAAKYITGIDYWQDVEIKKTSGTFPCYPCNLTAKINKNDIGTVWNNQAIHLTASGFQNAHDYLSLEITSNCALAAPNTNYVYAPIVQIQQLLSITPKFLREFNINMMLTMAAIGSNQNDYPSWTQSKIGLISKAWNMKIFDLIHFLISGTESSTYFSKSDYEELLSIAPCIGPNMNAPLLVNQDTTLFTHLGIAPKIGWNSINLWSHPEGTTSTSYFGEFNGNDYMMLYNLYRLTYGNIGFPLYENKPCQCNSSGIFKQDIDYSDNDYNNGVGEDPTFINIPNLTYPVIVVPRFSHEYNPIGIRLPEFLIHSMNIDAGGQVNTQTDLVLCKSGFLTVNTANGLIVGDPSGNPDLISNLTVRDGTTLIITTNNSMTISSGSQIVVESGGTLILQRAGRITIEDNAKIIIKPGGVISIQPDAVIELKGANALLDVQGTFNNLTLASAEQITFTKAGATGGGMAQFASGKVTMQTGSSFNNYGCRVKMFELDYSHDASFTIDEAAALVDFKQPCTITLNAGETMPVSTGGSAVGGTLNLNSLDDENSMAEFNLYGDAHVVSNQCKIKLNRYNFHYYKDANIDLNGDDATLRFGGNIYLHPDADLHFNGEGYLGFKLTQNWVDYKNIFADNTNTITLTGSGKNDKVAEIEAMTWVRINDDMVKFTLTDGHILFNSLAFLTIGAPYIIENAMLTGLPASFGQGILIGGQTDHKINNVTFRYLAKAVEAHLYWTNGSSLRITNSEFINCENGINAYDKGIILKNNTFTGCTTEITGSGMSFTSHLNQVITANGGLFGVINYSTSGTSNLLISHCNLNCSQGITFEGDNMLSMTCTQLNAVDNFNIQMKQQSDLCLSPLCNPGAGYNNLSSSNGILLDNANNVYFNEGHNNFSVNQPPLLSGQLTQCENTLDKHANNNQWYTGSTSQPSFYDYNVQMVGCGFSSPHNRIRFIDNSPQQITGCPTMPLPYPHDPTLRPTPLDSCTVCPYFQSNELQQVNHGFEEANLLISDGDTLNDDLNAFNILHNILSTTIEYDKYDINWVSNLAYNKMKTAFTNLFAHEIINSATVETQATMMLETIERRIEFFRSRDNDNAEFYSIIDKAAVLRLINNREEAVNTLRDIPACLHITESQQTFITTLIEQYGREYDVINKVIPVEEFLNNINSNRVFQVFANTQANIDSITTSSIPFGNNINCSQSAIDLQGNVYSICNETNVSLDFKLSRYNVGFSSPEWEQVFDGWHNATDSVVCMTKDVNDFLYITGKSWNGLDYDIATVKYDTAGNRYWTAIYNDLKIGDDMPLSLEVTQDFKVIIKVKSFNDTCILYKTIYYSQCDTNCIPQLRISKNTLTTDTDFEIIPNPTLSITEFRLVNENDNEHRILYLYNHKAQKVLTKNYIGNITLDLSSLPKGAYLARTVGVKTNSIYTKKFVIQ